MRCKTCHYDLSNLAPAESRRAAGHRCPECGREFDRLDPDSFMTAQESDEIQIDDRRWSITLLIILGGMVAALVLFVIIQ